MNVRLEGFHILYNILEEGHYSHLELQQFTAQFPDMDLKEKRFVERLVRGTLEKRDLLDHWIDAVSKTKVRKQKPAIRTILRLSVYQLLFMDTIPDSAVVNEAVKLAVIMKFGPLKGFVNGVLRSIIRKKEEGYDPIKLAKTDAERLSLQYSVPEWLMNKLLEQYAMADMEAMLEAMLKPVKLSVFNNKNKQTLQELKELLQKEGLKPTPLPYEISGFYLEQVQNLTTLKSFQQGRYLVQDVSSMIQGMVTAPQKHQYVIDACAAPGGKTYHAAIELAGTGMVDSGDIGKAKIKLLKENAKRLALPNVKISHRDALQYQEALKDKADIVIADLPCSGLGIMGRKPEIRYNLKESDITDLARLQQDMLKVLWQYVKPGGRLIYSTCTLTAEENIHNFNFLTEELPFEAESLDAYLPQDLHSETTKLGYLQLLPGKQESDGFFVASLRRKLNQ